MDQAETNILKGYGERIQKNRKDSYFFAVSFEIKKNDPGGYEENEKY